MGRWLHSVLARFQLVAYYGDHRQRTLSALLLHVLAVLSFAILGGLNDGILVAGGTGLCGNYNAYVSVCIIQPKSMSQWDFLDIRLISRSGGRLPAASSIFLSLISAMVTQP